MCQSWRIASQKCENSKFGSIGPQRLKHCFKLARLRKTGEENWIRPDSKTQVTALHKVEEGAVVPLRIHTVVVSVQHSDDISNEDMREKILEKVSLFFKYRISVSITHTVIDYYKIYFEVLSTVICFLFFSFLSSNAKLLRNRKKNVRFDKQCYLGKRKHFFHVIFFDIPSHRHLYGFLLSQKSDHTNGGDCTNGDQTNDSGKYRFLIFILLQNR